MPIRGLLLRRAVLGVLLRERGSMTVAEVVSELHARGVTTSAATHKPPNAVVADLLGYQVRIGRVVRIRRGVYSAMPAALSRTTKWRCLHWQDGLPTSHEF